MNSNPAGVGVTRKPGKTGGRICTGSLGVERVKLAEDGDRGEKEGVFEREGKEEEEEGK
jgi:hypothetical protein